MTSKTVGWRPKLSEWQKDNSKSIKMPEDSVDLLKEFQSRFPVEGLLEMTLEDYAAGKGRDDTFCYWLQYKTDALGSLGGTNNKWGVWWDESAGDWAYSNKFTNAEDAISKIRLGTIGLLESINANGIIGFDSVTRPLSEGVSMKIAFMYFPNEILPVFNSEHVAKFLTVMGIEPDSGPMAHNQQLLSLMKSMDEFRDFDGHGMVEFLYDNFDPRPPPETDWRMVLTDHLSSGDYKIWKITPGGQARLWSQFKKHNCIAIGWDPSLNYAEFTTRDELKEHLQTTETSLNASLNSIWFFANTIQIGDVVVASTGLRKVGGIGIVESEYLPPHSDGIPPTSEIDYRHFRKVRWLTVEETGIDGQWGRYTVTKVKPEMWTNVVKGYGIQTEPAGNGPRTTPIPAADEIVQKLIEVDKLTKNIILYGPPGTGKTWLANQFANYFKGNEDVGSHVRFVTFHQSFAYEDFVEGFRPVNGGTDAKGVDINRRSSNSSSESQSLQYRIEPGVFKQICEDAEDDWVSAGYTNDAPQYLLVIDEINRANISKVLGELITLIEDDKRLGADNEIQVILPYSKKKFGVPPNLHILGTMNTADRSIALLDVALRRRFAFVRMDPDPRRIDGSVGEVNLESLFTQLNQRLGAVLDSDHLLGHSYFMGIESPEQLDFAWYYRVVPLLEEYFHNDIGRLRAIIGSDFVKAMKSSSIKFDESNPGDYFSEDPKFQVIHLDGEKFHQALRNIIEPSSQITLEEEAAEIEE